MPLRRRICPHCDEVVSYNTFLKHKNRYYNTADRVWSKVTVNEDIITLSSDESNAGEGSYMEDDFNGDILSPEGS